jgi:Flp pilus assembly protein TadB
MSPEDKQSEINLRKDREAFAARERENSKRLEEDQLESRRQNLQEQMSLRQDYHSLKVYHWLIILSLLVSLVFFLIVLAASYFPLTKDYVMYFIDFII